MTQRITRRTFVKGTAATAAFAGMAAMAGCTSESKTETTVPSIVLRKFSQPSA